MYGEWETLDSSWDPENQKIFILSHLNIQGL
jgi:hypothetical protein